MTARMPPVHAGYERIVDPPTARMLKISTAITAAWKGEWPLGVVLTWPRGRTWYWAIAGLAVGGPADAILDLRAGVNAGEFLERLARAGVGPSLTYDPPTDEWTVEGDWNGKMLMATGETPALAAGAALVQVMGLLTPVEAE